MNIVTVRLNKLAGNPVVLVIFLVLLALPAFSAMVHAQTYCAATASYCDEYIGKVTVAGINNTTGCSYYANYTATVPAGLMDPGIGYPITVLNGGYAYSGDYVHVWLDFNNNGSFLDAGEYFSLTTLGGGSSFTGTITPPIGTLMGNKRMRVRMSYYVSPPGNPCGTESFGEVEDYTVYVTGCKWPTITAPANITLNNVPGQCGASTNQVNLGQPKFWVDACCEGPYTLSNDAPAYFPVGVPTVVTWTIKDGCGNKATASQTVTVLDTEVPSLWIILWPQFLMPPNGTMRNITAFVSATDNCPNIDWTLDGVWSNQPDQGTFTGDLPNDISATLGAKTTSFALRAENSPGRGSRLYTVRYKATDAGSHTVYSTKTITVQMGSGFGGPLIMSDDQNIPAAIELQQNYPNPFSGATSFTFRLPVDMNASLRVFDMLGREVATVADGDFPAGSHAVEFNGSSLPEGVYFYKLITGSYVVTKRMVVVR